MTTQVRRWTPEDFDAIRQVAWDTWESAYGAFIPEKDRRSFHEDYYSFPKLTDLYNLEHADGCVVELDGVIVGYSKSYWSAQRKEFFITSLYVLPEYQNRGLGKKMLDFGINTARKYKVDRVWLGVMVKNQPAVEWYERQDFHFVETRPFTIGNTTIDDFIGYKIIDQT